MVRDANLATRSGTWRGMLDALTIMVIMVRDRQVFAASLVLIH
jgi:hypothetical protein